MGKTQQLQERLRQLPPRRILVLGREHLGDIVNTTSALWNLKKVFPEAHLTVEVGERAAPVLENFPGIDQLWLRPTHQGALGKLKNILRIRRGRFDLGIVLDDSNDYILHLWLGGVPLRAGIWRGVRWESLYSVYVPFTLDRHDLRDHGEALLRELVCDVLDDRPRLFPSERDRLVAEEALTNLVKKPAARVVALHPGASELAKRWPTSHFAELADLLSEQGFCAVLVGGPSDVSLLHEVHELAKCKPVYLQRALSVLEFAALLEKVDLLVCADTGPAHLAAAMETSVVSLFGPTDPVHTGPWAQLENCIQGRCECPKREIRTCKLHCMTSITPPQVFEKVLHILRQDAIAGVRPR